MIRFRYFRVIFYTFRILLIYSVLLFLRKFLSSHFYDKLLSKVNIFVARSIRAKIFQFKGLFIKLGQYISVTRYIFSSEFGHEFDDFQDSVHPISYEKIKKRFILDFKKNPEELFKKFDEIPIAAASIGQVHIAYGFYGEKMAIKIIYPDIEDIIKIDFKLINLIMNLVHFFFPIYDPHLFFKEFSSMIYKELDFEQEKLNLQKIQLQFQDKKEYLFCKIFEKYSSKNILALEYIEGVKINNFLELEKKGISLESVAERLISAYYHMIIVHNEFHADPHPGNILIFGEGSDFKLAFIDFGSVKSLNQNFKKYVSKFLQAFLDEDIPELIQIMKKMGFIPIIENYDMLHNIFQFFFDRINELNISENQFEDLQFLFQNVGIFKNLGIEFKNLVKYFKIPPDYLYLWRTLILVFSLSSKLNTKLNAFQIAYPFVKDYLNKLKVEEYKSITNNLKKRITPILQLPKELIKILKIMNQDRFKMQVIGLEMNQITYIGMNIVYLFATFGFATFAFLSFDKNLFLLMKLFIGISSLFFIKFLISIIKNGK